MPDRRQAVNGQLPAPSRLCRLHAHNCIRSTILSTATKLLSLFIIPRADSSWKINCTPDRQTLSYKYETGRKEERRQRHMKTTKIDTDRTNEWTGNDEQMVGNDQKRRAIDEKTKGRKTQNIKSEQPESGWPLVSFENTLAFYITVCRLGRRDVLLQAYQASTWPKGQAMICGKPW